MDKELQRFLNGESNYYKGEATVTRERLGGNTFYEISMNGKILTQYWGKLGELPKSKADTGEEPIKKSTGGKKPYVMVMTNKLEELMKTGKTNAELNGYLLSLSTRIEWNTGRLINRRKKTPLTEREICKLFNISEKTWERKLKKLQENELLTVRNGGFYITPEIFKKGGVKRDGNKSETKKDQKEKGTANPETAEETGQ